MKKRPTTRTGRRCIVGVCLFLACCFELAGSDPATLVERFVAVREGATATFTHRIEIQCPPDVVERALDHPALIGALWTANDFTPRYRISREEEARSLQVVDPTGIVGEIRLVSRGAGRREFLGEGRIDHWAVPMLNRGSVAVEVGFEGVGGSSRIEIRVLVRPENWVAGAVVGAFSPVVEEHVGRRVKANARDLRTMMEAIAADPASSADLLEGEAREEFEALFPGP